MERVTEETADAEWNVENHPARETLERFDPWFGAWVNYLIDTDSIRQVGYPLRKNDLSPLEWKCLALVHQWRQAKNSSALA